MRHRFISKHTATHAFFLSTPMSPQGDLCLFWQFSCSQMTTNVEFLSPHSQPCLVSCIHTATHDCLSVSTQVCFPVPSTPPISVSCPLKVTNVCFPAPTWLATQGCFPVQILSPMSVFLSPHSHPCLFSYPYRFSCFHTTCPVPTWQTMYVFLFPQAHPWFFPCPLTPTQGCFHVPDWPPMSVSLSPHCHLVCFPFLNGHLCLFFCVHPCLFLFL